jgi:hypothetical protein
MEIQSQPALESSAMTVSLLLNRLLYSFTPRPAAGVVAVAFCGPRHSSYREVPTTEAREIYRRLLRRGFEKW